ncbi:hypothetical protein J6590_068438 [Homalodisca vitripennis]|nr:hypothetical protein J6590_068438 [Homalodisca vitripennis]
MTEVRSLRESVRWQGEEEGRSILTSPRPSSYRQESGWKGIRPSSIILPSRGWLERHKTIILPSGVCLERHKTIILPPGL